MKMEIRFFAKNERAVLQQAIHTLWANNHILSRDQKLLDYMFYDNPQREDLCGQENFSFIGLWDANKIIGLLGVLPYKLNINGSIKKGVATANWIALPEYGGAGLKILKPVLNYQPDMILSLGTNTKAATLHKMMRWHVLQEMPRWLGINHHHTIAKYLLRSDSASTLDYWPKLKSISTCPSSTIQCELDPEKWDDYYWKIFAKNSLGFARDYAYLKWRYLDHPLFHYQIMVSKDQYNNYDGLAVIRIENILNSEQRIGRIVEFISTHSSSSIALANEILVLDPSVLFWDFYSFSSLTTWGLESIGFRRKPKWLTDENFVPTRFQPLDQNIVNIMSSIYISKEIAAKFNYMDDMQWYITKGDADQDRPN